MQKEAVKTFFHT